MDSSVKQTEPWPLFGILTVHTGNLDGGDIVPISLREGSKSKTALPCVAAFLFCFCNTCILFISRSVMAVDPREVAEGYPSFDAFRDIHVSRRMYTARSNASSHYSVLSLGGHTTPQETTCDNTMQVNSSGNCVRFPSRP